MAKRTELTLSEKIVLLDKIKLLPLNSSHRILSEMFPVSKTTIGRLIKQEEDLRKKFSLKESMKQGKRQRSGKDPEVEEALHKWFKSVLDRGVRISGMVLRVKAEEFAVKLGKSDFVATEGWLSRWKTRHQIKSKLTHGEKSSANFEGVEIWVSTVLPQILEEYNLEKYL